MVYLKVDTARFLLLYIQKVPDGESMPNQYTSHQRDFSLTVTADLETPTYAPCSGRLTIRDCEYMLVQRMSSIRNINGTGDFMRIELLAYLPRTYAFCMN